MLLSNLYLHYVLDLWFERVVKRRLRGEAHLVRYIDDFVICFQYRSDALRVQDALRLRLGKFGLTLEPTKTKLVEFGRFAQRHAGKHGRTRPETIYFLGLTMYCTRNLKGSFKVGMRTSLVATSALAAQRIRSVGMSTYPISNADPHEERRLTLLESIGDPGTIQRLSNLGVGPGWRCLEVGVGRGSITKWLCEKVGITGSVVAIDIDTRFLDGIAVDNLQVLKLDVVDEPLPSGDFDLIHSRAVLTHLGARDVVLDKMIRALRPGGWLLLEEADGFPLTASGSEFFIKMMTPMVREWAWARKLPSLFAGHGLLDIGVDVRAALFNGGSPLPSSGAGESRARATCGSGEVRPMKA